MNLKHWLVVAATAALPLAATAQDAQTTRPLGLRAGPGRDYPLILRYGPGTPLAVQGCTSGYGWCDVIGPDGARGWVYANGLAYAYQSTYVPIITYGAFIGVPIVSFVIGDYWGRYYAGRPWYGQRSRWDHRPPPPPGPGFRPGFRPPMPGAPGFHPMPPPRGPGMRPAVPTARPAGPPPGGMQRPMGAPSRGGPTGDRPGGRAGGGGHERGGHGGEGRGGGRGDRSEGGHR